MVISTERIIGQKFGRLVVFSYAERNKHNKTQVNCICDCGATKIVLLANLKNKLVKSCGCLKKDASVSKNVKKEIITRDDFWASDSAQRGSAKERAAASVV